MLALALCFHTQLRRSERISTSHEKDTMMVIDSFVPASRLHGLAGVGISGGMKQFPNAMGEVD
jgi:hypothetical protein